MPSLLKRIKSNKGWLSKASKEQEERNTGEQRKGGDDDNQSQTSTTASSKTAGSRRRAHGHSQQSTANNTTSSSDRFLLEAPVLNPVALLNRREIQVGKLLGEGGFCEVLEVTRFQLAPPQNEACPTSCQEGMQQRRRERRRQDLAKSSLTLDNGMARYVIKQVSTKLLLIPGGFHQAAIDLVTEANYLMRLDHPHILKVHAMAMDGRTAFANKAYDDLFLVADRLNGTLRKRIDSWKYNNKTHSKLDTSVLAIKTNYALQIASALEYLHSQRIIYRDLKPENVGFLPCQKVETLQLFDFGLCRELPDENPDELFHMSRVGTPAYMAPEIASGGYNTKADVFSFACLYYELLVFKHPMKRSGWKRQAKGDRPDLSKLGLPDSIQELLQATWHESVAERLNSRQTRIQLATILSQLEGDEK